MIGVDRFGSVFGGAPAHTEDHLTEHLRAVVRAGYSPVLLQPRTKEPGCILSARQEVAADREVQQRALQLDPTRKVNRMRHACGFKHVIEAPEEFRVDADGKEHRKDPARNVGAIVNRFVARYGGMNIGLHLGRSRLLAVDVDTPHEVEAFRASWESADYGAWADGQPVPDRLTVPGLTVASPGSRDPQTGEWKHWGGGHWVFEVPEDYVFPAGKVLKGAGGWAAMWGESYILTPPSSRPEGPYRLVGGAPEAPAWLLEAVTTAGARRAADRVARVAQASDRGGAIDRWSAGVEWAQLLEPDGWTETSITEGSCGCPVWTAPGDHASPKSATAHEVGCALFDTEDGWGPLKIWTDHPPDGLPPAGAVTKLQYAAMTRFGGDVSACTRAFGIERDVPAVAAFQWRPDPGAASFPGGVDPAGPVPVLDAPSWGAPDAPGGALVVPGPVAPVADVPLVADLSSWATTDLTPYLDGTWSPPPPALLLRTDGQPLLYPGRTHSIYGEPESGKTWIGLLACAQAIKAQRHVLVVDLESDPGDLTFRLLLLGCPGWMIALYLHHVSPQSAPTEAMDGPAFRATWYGVQYAVVLIDALAGAMSLFGLDPKSDADVTTFYRGPMVSLTSSGACLIVVDHVIKDPDSRGRWSTGSERKVGALTGAAISVRSDRSQPFGVGRRGQSEVWLAKDRAGALRGIGGDPDRRTGMQQIGTFILDSQAVGTSAYVIPQPEAEESHADEVAQALADKIVAAVQRSPGSTKSAIKVDVGGDKNRSTDAINRLIDDGILRQEAGAGARQYLFYVELCDRPEVMEPEL